jgi:hypothetical protein
MAVSTKADAINIAKGVNEMGSGRAIDMKFEVDRGAIQMFAALTWHLESNHYPPIPTSFVPVAMDAIDKANAGELDEIVIFPEGLNINGRESMVAREIVNLMHLDSFIEQDWL